MLELCSLKVLFPQLPPLRFLLVLFERLQGWNEHELSMALGSRVYLERVCVHVLVVLAGSGTVPAAEKAKHVAVPCKCVKE